MSLSSSDPAVDVPATSAEVAQAVKALHRSYPTGVTIVAGIDGGKPYGLALNAFSSLSMEPPSLLFCVNGSAQSHPRLMAAERVVVNVLAAGQTDIARTFAVSGGDKFAAVPWSPAPGGAPIIAGAAGHFEVALDERIPAHTHTIFIGRVMSAVASGAPALLYVGGGFSDLPGPLVG